MYFSILDKFHLLQINELCLLELKGMSYKNRMHPLLLSQRLFPQFTTFL